MTDICYDLDDTILNVEVSMSVCTNSGSALGPLCHYGCMQLRKMVATGSSETVDTSSINRKNCYSLYPDTDMQLKHCGPKGKAMTLCTCRGGPLLY